MDEKINSEMTGQEEQERREARRRRRIRNQVLAYLTVILLIILTATGIVFGIRHLADTAAENDKKQQEQQSAMNELLQSEQDLKVPTQESGEEPVVELTYAQKLDQVVNAAIEVMPLEDKVAGLFLVTPEAITGVDLATQAGDTTREALSKYAVGGLIYSTPNMLGGKDGFKNMLDATVLYSKYPVFLAVEEEGGSTVQVAGAQLGEKTDDAKTIAGTGDASNAYRAGLTIGSYLSDLGINLNLAPAADLACVDGSVMEGRSFGSDPGAVPDYVVQMARGLEEKGVTACVKHFPGLGSLTTDTSKGVAVTERTQEEFRANEFEVFKSVIDQGVSMIMISNLSAPGLTGDNIPCTLSEHVVTDILRKEMNYSGLIITDALNEKAIADYYTADVAAIMALKAGCDMIMMPENFELAYNGVLDAVEQGTISEARIDDALKRIYRIKFADRVER